MPKVPVVPAKDFLNYLLKYGCILISAEGSHFKVENPKNGERSVVPIHGKRDLDRGFFRAILKQLDIDIEDFVSFIQS